MMENKVTVASLSNKRFRLHCNFTTDLEEGKFSEDERFASIKATIYQKDSGTKFYALFKPNNKEELPHAEDIARQQTLT